MQIAARGQPLTIAEITTVGIPTIFVPYPHAVDDHQTYNALSLVNKDAALIWQESESEDQFVALVEQLLNAENRAAMHEALRQVKKSQVSAQIAGLCEQVVGS